ncbi:MAG: CvpA family protein [Spirochaetales bacterium]|jgi:membrane protein required for colicin V production|nr:CvpA family protein [Spirochaetales bacterium]
MEWNSLDIVFAIIALFMLLRGLLRGALAEFFSVGAIAAGIAAAVIFSAPAGAAVEAYLGARGWGRVIAFMGIFLVTYVLAKIMEKLLRGFVNNVNLQNLDKALGIFLGLLEGIILVSLVIFALRLQPLFDVKSILAGSLCVRMLEPLMAFVLTNV